MCPGVRLLKRILHDGLFHLNARSLEGGWVQDNSVFYPMAALHNTSHGVIVAISAKKNKAWGIPVLAVLHALCIAIAEDKAYCQRATPSCTSMLNTLSSASQ